MQKQIVIINGTGGCGKTTFVETCAHYADVMNFSSVDKVKEIAQMIGWDGTKTERNRKFLADLKQLTTDFNDMPFADTVLAVQQFHASDNEFMFIHIREPQEIARAASAFGAKTLLIQRAGLEIITSNAADANINNYTYDYTIINEDLADLEEQAEAFIQTLRQSIAKAESSAKVQYTPSPSPRLATPALLH